MTFVDYMKRDAETATGELERYSPLKDLVVRGGCSRADIYIYLCLFLFTLVLYVPTPGNSFNHGHIRIYS